MLNREEARKQEDLTPFEEESTQGLYSIIIPLLEDSIALSYSF